MNKLDYLIEYLLKEDGRNEKHFWGDNESREKLNRMHIYIMMKT